MGVLIYHYAILFGSTATLKSQGRQDILKKQPNATDYPTYKREYQILDIGALLFTSNLIVIAQVICQTLLLIIGQRAKRSSQASSDWKQEMLWYVAICNGAKWMLDSLIDGTVSKNNPVKAVVFSSLKWKAISTSISPLHLFFRFHSMHLCVSLKNKLYS